MTKSISVEELRALRDRVKRLVASFDRSGGWREIKEQEQQLTRAMTGLGATVRQDFRGAAVKLAGKRSTSTSGMFGAVNNWLAATGSKAP